MLLSACSAEVVDEPIDESEPGSLQQHYSYKYVGKINLHSMYWASDRCVDVPDGNFYSGAKLRQWQCNYTKAQTFHEIINQDDGSRSFISDGTEGNYDLCLDVAGASKDNGAPVQLWRCNGTNAQRFWRGGSIYEATTWKNKGSGKCLDLDISGSYGNLNTAPYGSKLQQWDCNGWTKNQLFWGDEYM